MSTNRSRLQRLSRVIVLVLAFLVGSGPALAGDGDEAEAAIVRGVELRKLGKDEDALREFQRAFALAPSARALAQMGLASQALGRWVAAEVDLLRALKEKDDPWIERNRAPLEQALATVRRHLGSLEVETNAANAELWLNAEKAAELPLRAPLRVVAGTVVVEVRAPGHIQVRRTLALSPGATLRETLTLVRAGDGSREPVRDRARDAAPPSHGNPTLRIAGIVCIGVGVVGLGAGTYFGLRTLSDKSERDQHCSAAGCDATGLELDRDARREATISTIAFGAGIAAGATGVFLFLKGLPDDQTQQTERPRAGARIGPLVGSNGGGLSLGGEW